MGTYVAAEARFRLMDLASDLRRHGRRFELTVDALTAIRGYAEEQAATSTQSAGSLRTRLSYTSYDPDLLYRRHHCDQLVLLLYDLLQTVCERVTGDLEELLRAAPTDGISAERNFDQALAKKVTMYKSAVDHICGTDHSHPSLSDDLSSEIRRYYA